ncbi:MAG: phage terminase large subunit [Porphyromonadaceae bacterium]|nr:phage terminase large subunit [Porphyromonadaceae bacterium]
MELSKIIAPSFYEVHKDIKQGLHTHYWLDGGRGSTKSSFIGIEIPCGIMKDAQQGKYTNAVAIRKVGLYLKDSVHEQLLWGIEALGVSHLWDTKSSPQSLTYIPTGQKIIFRGADKPKKIKSIKFSKGYCKYIWYEELDEFNGMEEIRTINQSLMRGGEKFIVFYSYNPPKSVNNWVNTESQLTRPDRLTHHSTYLTVPPEWLGKQFLVEAEHLKAVNEQSYNHEYLGEVTGTGGEVFTNVKCRPITDEEIKSFTNVKRGLDFGYAADPSSYGPVHYDRKHKRLYIWFEVQKVGMSNHSLYEAISNENPNNDSVFADSAEPRTINELNQYGLHIMGVKKGPDSVDYGIKFLQDLEEIIIDDEKCPETAREFLNYELEKGSNGNYKSGYPDRNNHSIDRVRYALSLDIWNHMQEQKKPPPVNRETQFIFENKEESQGIW